LTINPEERISWQEFFNHRVFQDVCPEALPDSDNQTVDVEFVNNKTDCVTPTPVDPKDMQHQKSAKHINDSLSASTSANGSLNDSNMVDKKAVFKEYGFRYYHEKNKILMIFLTVKKARQLMKERDFSNIERSIYMLINVLAKKGSILSDLTLMSLHFKNNIFKLQHFSDFCTSEEFNDVVSQLAEDQKSIQEYKNYITNLSKDVTSLTEEDHKLLSTTSQGYIDLKYLDEKARLFYTEVRSLENVERISKISEQNRHLYLITMIFSIYSIKSETYMPYMVNDQKFEWDTFREKHEKIDSNKLWKQLESLTEEF